MVMLEIRPNTKDDWTSMPVLMKYIKVENAVVTTKKRMNTLRKKYKIGFSMMFAIGRGFVLK
jgi:hypothetical protein